MLKSNKLDTKLIKGRFVGYPKDSLGYCFYLPTEQVIVVSRDDIFLEKKFRPSSKSARSSGPARCSPPRGRSRASAR